MSPPTAVPLLVTPTASPLVLSPLETSPPMAGPDLSTARPPALTLPCEVPLASTWLLSVLLLLLPPLESVEQPAFWHAPVLLSAFDELSSTWVEPLPPPAPPAPPVAAPPFAFASPLVAEPLWLRSALCEACCAWMFAIAPSLMTVTSGLLYPNAAGATIRHASAVTSPPSHFVLRDTFVAPFEFF